MPVLSSTSTIPSLEYISLRELERERIAAEIRALKERVHKLEATHDELSDEIRALRVMRIPALNMDVVASILAHLPQVNGYFLGSTKVDYSLFNTCLVSKQWLPLGRIALYRSIYVGHKFRESLFLDSLERSPSLRPLVHRLIIDTYRVDIVRWCRLLLHLHTFQLLMQPEYRNWLQPVLSLRSLTDIALPSFQGPQGPTWRTIYQNWPQVRALKLDSGPAHSREMAPIESDVGPFSSLHSFSYGGGILGPIPSLGHCLQLFNLEFLPDVPITILKEACHSIEEFYFGGCSLVNWEESAKYVLPFSSTTRLKVLTLNQFFGFKIDLSNLPLSVVQLTVCWCSADTMREIITRLAPSAGGHLKDVDNNLEKITERFQLRKMVPKAQEWRPVVCTARELGVRLTFSGKLIAELEGS